MSDQTSTGSSDQWSPDVTAFLDELDRFPWFAHVGEPINEPHIKQVFSWDEAWEYTQDESWTNASFHAEVDQGHPVWPLAYDRALEAVAKSGRDHELEDEVYVSLQAAWDAGAAAYQIATGNQNGFYVGLMDWYRKGHWPCGWEGTYPEGRLIVY